MFKFFFAPFFFVLFDKNVFTLRYYITQNTVNRDRSVLRLKKERNMKILSLFNLFVEIFLSYLFFLLFLFFLLIIFYFLSTQSTFQKKIEKQVNVNVSPVSDNFLYYMWNVYDEAIVAIFIVWLKCLLHFISMTFPHFDYVTVYLFLFCSVACL